MRRYFLVQKAKDADVIGIVVGTLGVGGSPISHLFETAVSALTHRLHKPNRSFLFDHY